MSPLKRSIGLLGGTAIIGSISLAATSPRVQSAATAATPGKRPSASSLSAKAQPVATRSRVLLAEGEEPAPAVTPTATPTALPLEATGLANLGANDTHVTEAVPLYYYTDAVEVLKLLRPEATAANSIGYLAAKANADGLKLAVLDAEFDLRQADENLRLAKQRLVETEIKLIAARENKTRKAAAASKSAARKTATEKELNRLTKQIEDKQTEIDGTQDLAKKEKLTKERDELNEKKLVAAEQNNAAVNADNDATAALDTAKGDYDALLASGKSEQETIASGVTAQKALITQRQDKQKELALATAKEWSASAELAANKLRYTAPAVPAPGSEEAKAVAATAAAQAGGGGGTGGGEGKTTVAALASATNPNDPLQRVQIQTMSNGILLLRGRRADVDAVRKAINQIDQPVPQARATIWTIQVNGQNDRAQVKELAKTLDTVEEEMALARNQISGSIAIMQKCILEEVRLLSRPGLDKEKRLLNSAVLPQRYLIYSPDMIKELGLNDIKDKRQLYLDPLNMTCLGEVLMTLILSSHESRHRILRNFNNTVPDAMAALEADSQARLGNTVRETSSDRIARYRALVKFQQLNALLGYNPNESYPLTDSSESLPGYIMQGENNGFTPHQKYVVDMVKRIIVRGRRGKLIQQINAQMPESLFSYKNAAIGASTAVDTAAVSELLRDFVPNDARKTAQNTALTTKLSSTNLDAFGLDRSLLPDVRATLLTGSNLSEDAIKRQLNQLSMMDRDDLPFLAKGDQLVKHFVVAVEDDFDAQYVRPRLRALQAATRNKSVELGIIQRTSILTGNRRSSRVDPKATIEFNMPEGGDLLQQFNSLVKFVSKAGGSAASGGVTDALGSLGVSKNAGILGGLQDLASATPETAPQIYKVETGAGFEIVPILLPDAQTVAFDLNYTLTTPVSEPENARDRRISRVERHSMRSYVQDSNYEIRELSRFESATKLAQPERSKGGIPLLKELPVLRDIPLIGYFQRNKRKAAGLQESIIFVHSVVYPTVQDIIPIF